jgi:hypothetical protein
MCLPTDRAEALAALDEAHVACEYAALLGLKRDEAVTFLQHAVGLAPVLTHVGAPRACACKLPVCGARCGRDARRGAASGPAARRRRPNPQPLFGC